MRGLDRQWLLIAIRTGSKPTKRDLRGDPILLARLGQGPRVRGPPGQLEKIEELIRPFRARPTDVAARGCAHRILAASGKFNSIDRNALRRPNSSHSPRSILPPNRVPNGIAEYRGEGRQEFKREAEGLKLAPFSPGTPGEKGWG